MITSRRPVIVTPGLPPRSKQTPKLGTRDGKSRLRFAVMMTSVLAMSGMIGGQLVVLALSGNAGLTTTLSNPIAQSYARPDIVDRRGRLLATDITMPSLYADPSRILDRDAVIEHVTAVLPSVDVAELRQKLSDPSRKFVWIQRGVSPAAAQTIHNFGLPGLGFKDELKRAYPAGTLAGHTLGTVNVDNKGLTGIESHIDKVIGVEAVLGTTLSRKAPVQTSIDLGVQHIVHDELNQAMQRYQSVAASGVVLDVDTGEVIAAVSLPGVDPAEPEHRLDARLQDRVAGGTYELGSIFKAFTVAMALEGGLVNKNTRLNVTKPLVEGRFTIRDSHGPRRPMSVSEVFVHSSNVGAGLLALAAGPERHKRFLENFRLLSPMATEAGPLAAPQVPKAWRRIQQITISFGHGVAVSPLQFAASAAALINGGRYLQPTFLRHNGFGPVTGERVLSAETSRTMRELMRLNVTHRSGTGRRADVPGYDVGGKTGTAEVARGGRYKKKTVISSFVAGFPMKAPRYLILVSIFEPKGTAKSGGKITASRNAAPTTGRIIRRIAPILNVAPADVLAARK